MSVLTHDQKMEAQLANHLHAEVLRAINRAQHALDAARDHARFCADPLLRVKAEEAIAQFVTNAGKP